MWSITRSRRLQSTIASKDLSRRLRRRQKMTQSQAVKKPHSPRFRLKNLILLNATATSYCLRSMPESHTAIPLPSITCTRIQIWVSCFEIWYILFPFPFLPKQPTTNSMRATKHSISHRTVWWIMEDKCTKQSRQSNKRKLSKPKQHLIWPFSTARSERAREARR